MKTPGRYLINRYLYLTSILVAGTISNTIGQVHVQTTTLFQTTTATTIARAFGAASTSGHLIVVHLDWDGQTRSIISVTDNKGNTYARINGPTNWNGVSYRAELWYAYNIIGGGAAITVTATLSGAPTSFSQIYMSEYSGIITTNPLDQNSVAIGNTAAVSSGSKTTTHTNELVYGASIGASGVLTTGAGFTNRSAANSNIIEDKNVAAGGSYNASFTSASGNWIAQMATFISTSSTLPIDLLSFTGKPDNNAVDLQWVTAAEINNDYFTIQRSTNELGWEELIKVPGVGTSSVQHSYSAKDPSPYPGITYYRLKQTDIDGKSTYSMVVAVATGNNPSAITIYPNPAQDLVKIKFPVTGNYQVELINSNGGLIGRPVFINNMTAELNVSALSTGVYFIRTIHEGIIETQKILINK